MLIQINMYIAFIVLDSIHFHYLAVAWVKMKEEKDIFILGEGRTPE